MEKEPDGYYDTDDAGAKEEIDLSFLDEPKKTDDTSA